jgi:hypothetical protein
VSSEAIEQLVDVFRARPAVASGWLSLLGLGEGDWAAAIRRGAVELTSGPRCVVVTTQPSALDVERADAVVLLSSGDETFPDTVADTAGWQDVRLVRARWSDLGRFAESSGGAEGRRFAAMLVDEGLLPAIAVGASQWTDFDTSKATLCVLLREVLAGLAGDRPLEPKVVEDDGSVYGLVTLDREQIGLGFARDSRALGRHLEFTPSYLAPEPLVYSFVHALGKPGSMVARMALAEAGGIGAAWGTHPVVARPVPHVVFAEDFAGQAGQLTRFAREIAERYRAQGYLRSS